MSRVFRSFPFDKRLVYDFDENLENDGVSIHYCHFAKNRISLSTVYRRALK